jgi:hypothetical protein
VPEFRDKKISYFLKKQDVSTGSGIANLISGGKSGQGVTRTFSACTRWFATEKRIVACINLP